MTKIINLGQKTLNQDAFLDKNADDNFLNSDWFFKPFEDAMATVNMRKINDLARNLNVFFPDFWDKYTQIKVNAVETYAQTHKRTPKNIRMFAHWSINKQYIPIELHRFDQYTEQFPNYANVRSYLTHYTSNISEAIHNLMFDDFKKLVNSYDLNMLFTTDPKPKYFVKQSEFERISRLFDKLLFELESNLVSKECICDNLSELMQQFLSSISMMNSSGMSLDWDIENNKIKIIEPHVIYDDGIQYAKMK
jgi:hypothetical protein